MNPTGPADAKWTALRRWLEENSTFEAAKGDTSGFLRTGLIAGGWAEAMRSVQKQMRRLDRQAPRSPRKAK